MRTVNTHGTAGGYSNGCDCGPCKTAWRQYSRQKRGSIVPPDRDQHLDQPWVILDFPVALVARKAFPNDTEAINAVYGPTP